MNTTPSNLHISEEATPAGAGHSPPPPPAPSREHLAVSTPDVCSLSPPRESARQREEYAYAPAFILMLVMTAAERYLAACMLTQAANKGSWLAIEAYVFLFDRQPTFLSILLGFDIQEFNPVLSPLTFLRGLLQLVHFGLHWLLAYVCFRWCYRLSRLAGHAACAVAAILMVALWFVVLPALGAHLPGPRKAEKEPPRKVTHPFD